MSTRWIWVRGVMPILILATAGCGGYWPVLWPKRTMWVANPIERSPIQLPTADAAVYPNQLHKDGVVLVVDFMTPTRTKDTFHADLLLHGIQPLFLIVENRSKYTYAIAKSTIDPHYIPAARAARQAFVHPVTTTLRTIKWLTFLLPGIVMESVVEPTSTLDFPKFEEAAQRPPKPDNASLKAAFEAVEMVDGPIGPQRVRSGVVFVRPLTLGSVIPVTLINTGTQQPLVFDILTPPPLFVDEREYPYPSVLVWDTAVKTVRAMTGWRVASVDQPEGMITLQQGVRVFGWKTTRRTTITVHAIDEHRTSVKCQSSLRRSDSAGAGERSRNVDRFLQELDQVFPLAPPAVTGASSTESANATTARTVSPTSY